MTDVSMADILFSREERVRIQGEISKRFSCPIISFTMNIAGPKKNSSLIARAFSLGIKSLDAAIDSKKILYKHIDKASPTGPLAIFAVNENSHKLKEICTEIEEKNAIGRLFDMDVIDESLNKIEREHERCCIICGAAGRTCAAGRLHPLDEITAKMKQIMTDALLDHDASRIAEIASQSLINEVKTTPKPGLVDMRNNGSHKDMSMVTFERSAVALTGYFKDCVLIGNLLASVEYNELFLALRNAGIKAEECMYKATNGVNTHKGAIYSFGILCSAIGRIWSPDKCSPDINSILDEAANIAKTAIEVDLSKVVGTTAGERMYLERGNLGIRGEAASGFTSVRNISLPIYKEMISNGISSNDAGVISLLNLIANIEDSTIYNRGGFEAVDFARHYAHDLLKNNRLPSIADIEEMDDVFIKKNLSAGGSADLLAVTYFLYETEKNCDEQI